MKFKYDSTLYDLADGRFIGRFLGVSEFDPSQLPPSPYGTYGHMVAWNFHIENGENHGKPYRILTPANPTEKNACMRVLCGIVRQNLKEGEEVDPDKFKGCFYAISVIDGKPSNKFPPQYLGKDMNTALRTFDPDATLPAPAEQPKQNDSIPF